MSGYASRMGQALRHPVESAARLLGKVRPDLLLSHYARLARRQGLKQAYFILSFDCDTELDIEVVESVHARLGSIGILPVYAVPGQLLEQGAAIYRRIAASGAEFINHGFYTHTRWCAETRAYESSFFYDQLPHATILEDMQRGHQALWAILERRPTGYRVPHFGTFQRREQLRFLHETLCQMSYDYSSSTVPLYGFLHGPAPRLRNGVYEIPVSGCYDMPLFVLDSWSFRYAPGRRVDERDYLRQFTKMASFFSQGGRCGLLNYYADPSQVHDWPDFFECMKLVAPMALNSYEILLHKVLEK